MTNEEMVKNVKELLKTDADFDFLLGLNRKDLEQLVACVRGRVDQVGPVFTGGRVHYLSAVTARSETPDSPLTLDG